MSQSVNSVQGCLRPANFADHDAVRPLPQRLTYQVSERDRSSAVKAGFARLHLREVRHIDIDLEHFFASHDPAIGWNFSQETVHERRLARSGRTGNEDRCVLLDAVTEEHSSIRCHRSTVDKVVEVGRRHDELAYLDVHSIRVGHGWTCDVHSATRRQLRRHDRVRLIHSSSGTRKQLISNAPHSVLIDYNIDQLLH